MKKEYSPEWEDYLWLAALITDKYKIKEFAEEFTDEELQTEEVWQKFKRIFYSDALNEAISNLYNSKLGREVLEEYGKGSKRAKMEEIKRAKLHERAINKLKELGVTEGLWLVEVSNYATAAKYYGERRIYDLTQFDEPEDTHIIYYHESGSIEQHSTFNPDDQESFNEAVKWIARYLGA